jgi:hypothetical protein
MRAALRHLCHHGVEALRSSRSKSKIVTVGSYVAKPSRDIWHRPLISKRVANVIRKHAIREGTYGSFDNLTGVGWEPTWDLVLYANRFQSQRIGNLQPSKKSSRQRSREERARKLEENLAGQAQAMEEYYAEKERAKVKDYSFEAKYKRMMRGTGKA